MLEGVKEIIGDGWRACHLAQTCPRATAQADREDNPVCIAADLSALQDALEEHVWRARRARVWRCAPGEPLSVCSCANIGQQMGLTELEFRLLPSPVRMHAGHGRAGTALSDLMQRAAFDCRA